MTLEARAKSTLWAVVWLSVLTVSITIALLEPAFERALQGKPFYAIPYSGPHTITLVAMTLALTVLFAMIYQIWKHRDFGEISDGLLTITFLGGGLLAANTLVAQAPAWQTWVNIFGWLTMFCAQLIMIGLTAASSPYPRVFHDPETLRAGGNRLATFGVGGGIVFSFYTALATMGLNLGWDQQTFMRFLIVVSCLIIALFDTARTHERSTLRLDFVALLIAAGAIATY